MSSRFYPSLADIMWSDVPSPEWLSGKEDIAWRQTVAAMQQLWSDVGLAGVGASGPVAWWPGQESDRDVLPGQRWLFTTDLSVETLSQPQQTVVPVMPRDPLQSEPFFCTISPVFCAIAVRGLHAETGEAGVMFSFDPQVVERLWQSLRLRLQGARPDAIDLWDAVLEDYPLSAPDFRILSRFSSLLMMSVHDRLPLPQSQPKRQLFLMPPAAETEPVVGNGASHSDSGDRNVREVDARQDRPNGSNGHPADDADSSLSESALLRAIAHEVQTPLATIRTLTRLLLRRDDLSPVARRYVQNIERECTEQIDRFGLFFRATELDPETVNLQSTSLSELLAGNLPRWQHQVERRGSTFELEIDENFPAIVSDPNTLDAMLSGVIDRISRTAPAGSRITARATRAGEQVKLQFQINAEGWDDDACPPSTPAQALGQWLVVQPETGALSLSIPMTQHLFEALGARFTVRHLSSPGETLTIYLPQHQ